MIFISGFLTIEIYTTAQNMYSQKKVHLTEHNMESVKVPIVCCR